MDEGRDRLHRRFNYQLCRAVDLLALGVVLDEMVREGVIHPQAAKIFNAQASAFLAALRTANNAAFGQDPASIV